MKESDSAIVAVRDDFFARRSWQRKQCPLCLEEYYTKRDLPHCGSYRCAGGYPLLNIPAPKVYLELGACAENFREFFTTRGYRLHPPVAIVRSDERTLFASTAGQVFDDLIYGQSPQRDPQQCAVMQPVIRLQGIGLVASLDGISTSFVHTATECWNATTEKHFNSLDQWLDFFSGLGLHVGGLCLKLKCADNDWAGRTVTSEMLKINYDGLEVGVANLFFNITHQSGDIATLSDIGVGLERLVWAVNKSPAYFDGIGPLSSVTIHKRVALDAIRTATLMAGSGVVPDHKNQGSKLRAMIGLIMEEAQHLNLYELVRYYHRQWTSFVDLPVSREQTYSTIWSEINRGLNLETNRVLGIDEPFEQGHEEFLRRAVQKRVIPIARLWDIKRRTT
ncbi:MAG TPA: hypothetical protein DEP53_02495 [Bacteroidetes bacterium]|uniref:Alanine--tRNA ligase n=1 Tax=Candidatus Taylorbacteria bacterium RIFCSPHIGHO2_02_49_25 TaxID=1802305 RepID=A0A1G2MFS0_9BACT|nr:MAG: hypothetical protein UY62_C0074G0002 [Parcubacteria group bacterium GW2011_GWF2_50_9]OHA22728.1 MAG: hypothetical protein A2W52_04380 [Candidatus Taylorbacteria bacterium RIFCSPHIGHO2_02_49_25]OHA36330.1 MAG: hypothetical protein A2W65_03055 [Candidatus Taylorbacteria bacterium RIFCSPLOWO2_02_50_13]HCA78582.1 hypothetical protein [Bacteroidota bacterium]